MKIRLKASASLAAALSFVPVLLPVGTARAQSTEATTTDTIIVTGSNIARNSQANLASPLDTISRAQFNAVGAKDIRDVIETLTINTGAQNNADSFTQGQTTGTSNINLRGLGVASTLVLLNGKRQVQSAVQTSEGVSFVDTSSLVPAIAIERLEILKDGASAIYGSEAIAGVANFITRDNFVGLELSADGQFRATNGTQEDFLVSALAGIDGGWGHLVVAASYFDRSILDGSEIDFLGISENSSGLGNPGSFFVTRDDISGAPVAQGSPGSSVVLEPDPRCTEFETSFLGGPLCRFNFGPNQTFVPDENRTQAFARYTNDFTDNLSGYGEFSYARNRVRRVTSPSLPTLLNTPTVPGDAPFNIFAVDVDFFGRPLGSLQPSDDNFFEYDTYRINGGLKGTIANRITWDVSVTHAVNETLVNQRDTIVDNYLAAIEGFGGFDCDPTTSGPGEGQCQFFNPFASSLDPTTPEFANSPELIDFIIGDQFINGRSELTVVDAVFSTTFGELPGGEIGIAIGGQYRADDLAQDFDAISNEDGFSFLVGGPDFSGSGDSFAGFGEISLPIFASLEIQAAVRHERTQGLSTTDPKVAVLYRPSQSVSLRGSYSTSFRAPSLFQTIGTQTSFAQVSDPLLGGSNAFISVRSFGDPDLLPETSRAFNAGGSFQYNNFSVDIDYYDFAFDNVLTQENQQSIIDSDPNDPRVIRTAAGTISQVLTAFVNANSIDTSGIDWKIRYDLDTQFGTVTPNIEGTYVIDYDLVDASGNAIDGAGNRNFTNFASPTPTLRFNAGLSFASNDGNHSANIFGRYISGLSDDQNGGDQINDIITLDAQYNYSLNGLFGSDNSSVFSVGIINAFDQDPPFVLTNGNFEPRVFDARGRRIYVRVKTQF